MRGLMCFVCLLPGAALADTVLATSEVTAVTIYPQGAQVVREVVFDAPAGTHEVLITDLPLDTEAEAMRLSSVDVGLGAFALRTDRLPPRGAVETPAMLAAKAEVKAADAALRQARAKVAGIAAEVEAQDAQIKFLTGVKMNDATATVEALSSVAQMIGTQVLAARKAALAAEEGLALAQEAVATAEEKVTAAEDALAALSQRDEDYAALSVAVTTTGGTGHLVVSSYVYDASWAPVYDMTLDRKAGQVAVARGVLVSQASGEDWAGVDLTLSTAQPDEKAAPTELYPEFRQVVEPDPVMRESKAADMAMEAPTMAAPVVAAAIGGTVASMGYQGDTVVYHYPAAVDVATGVENLRLALDSLTLPATVQARAVPRYDSTAFVLAEVTNAGPDILLPGQAYLYRDGALVGGTMLEALAPGDTAELGFGAIEGIRLTRDMPLRAEGDRGVFTSSTQIEEKAVLQVKNLTGEGWPVRVLDLVPYSEQEELEITYKADPAVTEADVDGKRGILAWDFDLGAGETKEISLTSVLSWPEGKVLQ